MLATRVALEPGRLDDGWLRIYHAFSIADYFDPAQMWVDWGQVLYLDPVGVCLTKGGVGWTIPLLPMIGVM